MTHAREFIELPAGTRERIAALIENLIDLLDALDEGPSDAEHGGDTVEGDI